MTFELPADSEEAVAAVRARYRAIAAELHRAGTRINGDLHVIDGRWGGAAAPACQHEVSAIARLTTEAAEVMHQADAALLPYQEAIAAARQEIGLLERHYVDQQASHEHEKLDIADCRDSRLRRARAENADHYWQAAAAKLSGRHAAVMETVAGAAARARARLEELGSRIDGRRVRPRGSASARVAVLPSLPMLHEAAVLAPLRTMLAASSDPEKFAATARRLRPWASDPLFAAALLRRCGVGRVRDLLAAGMGSAEMPPYGKDLYAFLGIALGAGTRGPNGVGSQWLSALTAGMRSSGADEATIAARRGLGSALRHGTYGRAALDVLVPALLDAHDAGRPGVNFDDPAIGAMHALSTNTLAGQEWLLKPGVLQMLLSRVWPSDSGKSLGALLASIREPRNDATRQIAAKAVHQVGKNYKGLPIGVAPGLARLLASYSEDVARSLMVPGSPDDDDDSTSTKPNSKEIFREGDRPPRLDPNEPAAGFNRHSLARTLYAVMQSPEGAKAIYSGQAVYTAALVSTPHTAAKELPTVRMIGHTYGRLNEIHTKAEEAVAQRDYGRKADELAGKASLIRSISTSADIIVGLAKKPGGPVTGLAIGKTFGAGIDKATDWAMHKWYDGPLNEYERGLLEELEQDEQIRSVHGYELVQTAIDRLGEEHPLRHPEAMLEVAGADSYHAGRDSVRDLLPELDSKQVR